MSIAHSELDSIGDRNCLVFILNIATVKSVLFAEEKVFVIIRGRKDVRSTLFETQNVLSEIIFLSAYSTGRLRGARAGVDWILKRCGKV